MSLLSAILPRDDEGVKWAKLQRLFRQMADNAGISYALGFPLTDIHPSDTEGIKWQKLGAWAKLIADNIGGGGGGGVTSIAGTADQIVASAATGNVVLSLASAITSMGEIIKKQNGNGVELTNNAVKTVVYLDLPVGSWEVWGNANDFEPLGGDPLLTAITSTISLVNDTLDFSQAFAAAVMTAGALSDVTMLQPWAAFTFAVPTRVYLVSKATFSANGVTVYGQIVAQRIPSVTVQP